MSCASTSNCYRVLSARCARRRRGVLPLRHPVNVTGHMWYIPTASLHCNEPRPCQYRTAPDRCIDVIIIHIASNCNSRCLSALAPNFVHSVPSPNLPPSRPGNHGHEDRARSTSMRKLTNVRKILTQRSRHLRRHPLPSRHTRCAVQASETPETPGTPPAGAQAPVRDRRRAGWGSIEMQSTGKP